MDSNEILSGVSFLPNKYPTKLIFMLHGYGDSAENFTSISSFLQQTDIKANYYALNAPYLIPNNPLGRQWFDLNPNGIYIANAGPSEIKIIRSEILQVNEMLKNTIETYLKKYKLSYEDCLLLGFSQGGMMVYEFANFFTNQLAGLAILSGRILSENVVTNKSLLKTPIFISHGDNDDVLSIKVYEKSCNYMKNNNLIYESHKLIGDTHTISPRAIHLLKKFIKKTMI